MSSTNEITTLRIKKTTRDLIDSLAQGGESFDDIIRRLAEFYKDNGGKLMNLAYPGSQS